ncbi:MAG: hypothetical protein EOP53_14775 [Sphingobacteriales bacterium]|nr:MAG: hypothetical protein EOP53_14775 [Sphingobacteriales bacterium]
MRRIIFFTLVLLFSLNCFAQETTSPKNEIGVSLFSYQCNYVGYADILLDNIKEFQFVPFGGVSYKKYFGKHILRSNISYREIVKLQSKSSNSFSEGIFREGIFKIGYERQFIIHKKLNLIPFLALDLGVMHSWAEGAAGGGITGFYYNYDVNETAFRVSPTFGIRYNFTDKLSLLAETCVDIQYSAIQVDQTQISPRFPIYEDDYDASRFYVIPTPISRFSLNVKF